MWHDSSVSESSKQELLLSSRVTLVYKVALPAIILGVFAPVVWNRMWSAGATVPGRTLVIVVVCAMGFATLWLCVSLKKVSVTGDRLVVSNYLELEAIPLGEIASVSATRLLSPEIIWIRLKRTTNFGRLVLFMPTPRVHFGFSEHPSAQTLRNLIAERIAVVERRA